MMISTSTLRTSLLNAALFTATVSAAEISFNTNALTTSEATSATNWVGGVAPGAADIAAWKTDVDAVTAGNQESRGGTITIASPVSWLGLRHQDSLGPMTLTGSDITLGASGITEVVFELLNINNNIVLGADQPWSNAVSTTVNGAISGGFGITKSGAGSLVLNGANTYTGPTSVAAGTLAVTSLNSVVGGTPSSALGAPVTVANGTIALSTAAAQTTLLYTGIGETSDRVVRFASGQGGIITQNGTGLLNLTSDMTGAAAAMGVTFNGGGTAQMKGITNTTALLNFNKGGAGIWNVTGNLTLNGGNIRPQGGVLSFSPTATTTGTAIISGRSTGGVLKFASGSGIITSTANTNGILGGWATVDGTTWAVANGASAINGLASFTADTWAAGTNTDVTLAGANPAAASTTHSLRFNAAGAKTLTLSGINSLSSGGLLVTPAVGANATTITGGTLNAANTLGTTAGATVVDLALHQNNTGGDLTVASIIANSTAPATRAATTTTASAVIPGLSTTADLVVGMTVAGTGLAANSTIASINSATQITLNANVTTGGTPTLTFGTSVNPLIKTGTGTAILSAANTYTGTTYIHEGALEVQAKAGGTLGNYIIGQGATLRFGYAVGNSYTNGVTVHGAGTAATTGLYLKGGLNINLQNNGGLNLVTAPTTVRTYGTGSALLSGYDTNGVHLTVAAAASGSVFSPTVNLVGGSFGYVMNIAAGNNTATGDMTIEGQLTGNTIYRKTGTGSLAISGAGTNTSPLDIRAGTVFLRGGNNRLGAGSSVIVGNAAVNGKLVLEGISQTIAGLSSVGTGTANAIVGGGSTPSTLIIANTAASTFPSALTTASIGGTGTNENNIALGKTGAGVLTLTGTNTHTGGTLINGGTLSLGSFGALGTEGVITMNGGTLQFSAANTTDYSSRILLADGTSSGIDTNGFDVTFASPFQVGALGTGGINKLGSGILTLAGSHVYTGATTVTAGTLRLDYSASNTSKLADSSTLKLAGGTIDLSGGSHVEVVASTEITSTGAVTITRSSGSAVLQLGDVTRSGTGTLDISVAGIARTTTPNDSSGKLPAYITVAGQPASNDGSGNVVVYNGFVNINRLGGKIPNNPAANVRIVNGGTSGDVTPLATGLSDIATLLQNATAGPATVVLGGSDTLRLGAAGAVIVPATSGALTITGGSLTAGGADETNGEIAVDADGEVTLASPIFDNGIAGIVSITKTGTGSLALAESNSNSGGTFLNEGTLRVNHFQGLGLGALHINGGSLDNTSGDFINITDALAQTWDANIDFVGTNDLRFGAGAVTLTGARTIHVGGASLGFGGALTGAFGITKTGPGLLTLDGANSYTGGATVSEGVLQVNGNSGGKLYTVGTSGTLELGYAVGNGYGHGVTVNGSGTAATTGLSLKGGLSYSLAETLFLNGAPTTVRSYGGGTATLAGWDTNRVYLNASAAASGSVFDSNINFTPSTYGYRMVINPGANTATGDVTIQGKLTGAITAEGSRFQKEGTGSLVLSGQSTNAAPFNILAGTVILSGGDDRIGTAASVAIGTGTGSAKLVLNGNSQTLGGLSTSGTGTTNAVTNGSATPATLTVNYSGAGNTFAGVLGGTGTDENNFSVVKSGTGTWTLSGANSYTGNTTVSAGTLAVVTSYFANGADVVINNAATSTLNLQFSSATPDVIDELIVDGLAQPAGIYGALGSGAQFQRAYITGTGRLSVTTGGAGGGDYGAWATLNGVDGVGVTAETDSDGDGIPNGIEFVIGGDPSGPNSDSNALLPTISSDANNISFVFRRTDDASAYDPYVQYSKTLAAGSWTTAEAGVNGVTIEEDDTAFPLEPGVVKVTVKIPKALAAPGSKLFASLRIDIP